MQENGDTPHPTGPGSSADGPISSLPSTGARALAFGGIVLAGLCGGLIGYAFVDLQCEGDCTVQAGIGGLLGAVVFAAGTGVVAVLALRAMNEWNTIKERDQSDPAVTPPDDLLLDLVDLASEAAVRAGDLLLTAQGRPRTVDHKSTTTDLVTEMDRAAETLIVEHLLSHRGEDSILAEEGSERAGTSGVRWVIDPLDGTTNYVYAHPGWGVSIGAEVNGTPAVGVVADPVHGDLYTARLGGGAFCNGAPIRVSTCADLGQALAATGFGYDRDRRAAQADALVAILPRIRDIRRMGAAAIDLCAVARGRVDLYFEAGLSAWDMAAGSMIAAEAGARVLSMDGGPPRPGSVLAAPPALIEPLLELLDRSGAAALGS